MAAFVIMVAGAVISILVFSLEKILPQALSNSKQATLLKRFGAYESKWETTKDISFILFSNDMNINCLEENAPFPQVSKHGHLPYVFY